MGDRHFSHDFCWRFVLPQSEKGRCDGSQERIVAAEYDGRIKTCLGPFQDWVGTLAGEIALPAQMMRVVAIKSSFRQSYTLQMLTDMEFLSPRPIRTTP